MNERPGHPPGQPKELRDGMPLPNPAAHLKAKPESFGQVPPTVTTLEVVGYLEEINEKLDELSKQTLPYPVVIPTGQNDSTDGQQSDGGAQTSKSSSGVSQRILASLRNNPALIKYITGALVSVGVVGGFIADSDLEYLATALTGVVLTVLGVSARDSSYGPVTVEKIKSGEEA